MVCLSTWGQVLGFDSPGGTLRYNISMEVIKKVSDVTIPRISVHRNGRIRFSAGAVAMLNLQAGDKVSFYRDGHDGVEWFMKRFGGNVELKQERHHKGLAGYHCGFVRAFLLSLGDGLTKATCRIATTPDDEGMYAILTVGISL